MKITINRRLRAARKKVKAQKVKLYALDYDGDAGEFHLLSAMVDKKDLPREAVHVTGERGAYLVSCLGEPERSAGITAADLHLYMLNSSINDALAVNWRTNPEDMKRYIVYGIAGIILVCVVYAMM